MEQHSKHYKCDNDNSTLTITIQEINAVTHYAYLTTEFGRTKLIITEQNFNSLKSIMNIHQKQK